MAVRKTSRGGFWSRLHFLIRLAGLTGLLAAGIGAALIYLEQVLPWETIRAFNQNTLETVRQFLEGETGDKLGRIAVWLALAGAVAAVFAFLVEMIVGFGFAAGRRSVFGFNVLVQIGLAVAVVVGINVYSFSNYERFDWTRDQKFTLAAHLPPATLEQLRRLKNEPQTTIVVYQQHKTFGHLSEKPDAYDYAAERKVVEKIHDLVEQFREFGPQFRVVTLDVEEEGYTDKLGDLTRNAKELREAIEGAPDNSILFYTPDGPNSGKVQRLSFNDFYQLDKTASREANEGRGNLVLIDQGPMSFTRKVLNIQEKRPRVAVAVTFEVLTTEGPDLYGLRGVKKALTTHGFDVRDVILKKITPMGGLEPAAYSYEESRFGSLEVKLTVLDAILKQIAEQLSTTLKRKELLNVSTDEGLAKAIALRVYYQSPVPIKAPVEEITRQILAQLKRASARDKAEERREQLFMVEQEIDSLQKAQQQFQEQRAKRAQEREELNDESFAEQRRITDVTVKLDRLLEDCDLLIIPRMTILSLAPSLYIPNEVHRLEPSQVKAIQDFLKAGKPVLACFGPTSESPRRRRPRMQEENDAMEELLAKLGITLGKQTVLFDAEAESLASSQGEDDLEVPAAPERVPPVDFDWKSGRDQSKVNPVRAAMRVATRSVGKSLDLEIHFLRPVSYEPPKGTIKTAPTEARVIAGEAKGIGKAPIDPVGALSGEVLQGEAKGPGKEALDAEQILPYSAMVTALPTGVLGMFGSLGCTVVMPTSSKGSPKGLGLDTESIVMMTNPASWKEDQPFPGRNKPLLPTGEKRGPVPVGVAVEAPLPADWFGEKDARPARSTVRVAVIGHGGWFAGPELSPAKEKLLVDLSNWLLRRDELLVKETTPAWKYPRVHLAAKTSDVWHWGTQLGLPLLFVYLGLVVLLVRRLR
jgi:hypothetical protein